MVITHNERTLKKKKKTLIKIRKNTKKNKRGGMLKNNQPSETKAESNNQLSETKVNRFQGTAMNIALGNNFSDTGDMNSMRSLNTEFQSETPFKLKNSNEIGDIQPKNWDSLITVLKRACIKKMGGYEIGNAIKEVDLSNKHISLVQIQELFFTLNECPIIKILKLNKSGLNDFSLLWPLPQSLTLIDLNDNQISMVSPFQHLTILKELSIEKNRIQNIDALRLVSLTKLQLGWNRIVNIGPITRLVNLTILGLGQNQINNIVPLGGLVNLTSLDLNGNLLVNIEPLQTLVNLTNLNLNHNLLVNIGPLKDLANLSELTLSHNQINNIEPLRQMTTLVKLDLSYNRRIVDIVPLQGFNNLMFLNLSNNAIIIIEALRRLVKMERLDIGVNRIDNIEPLENLTNLTGLGLYDNQIINIKPLHQLTNLTTLIIKNNQIIDIDPLRSLVNITSLYIGNNQIVNIGPLQRLSNLTDLNLGNHSPHKAFQDILRSVGNHDYYVYKNHPPTIDNPSPNTVVRRRAKPGDYKHIGTMANVRKGFDSQERLARLHGDDSYWDIRTGLTYINNLKNNHNALLREERDIPDADKTAKMANGFRLYKDPASTQWKSLGNYDFKNRDATIKRRITPHPEEIERTLKRGGEHKRKTKRKTNKIKKNHKNTIKNHKTNGRKRTLI